MSYLKDLLLKKKLAQFDLLIVNIINQTKPRDHKEEELQSLLQQNWKILRNNNPIYMRIDKINLMMIYQIVENF